MKFKKFFLSTLFYCVILFGFSQQNRDVKMYYNILNQADYIAKFGNKTKALAYYLTAFKMKYYIFPEYYERAAVVSVNLTSSYFINFSRNALFNGSDGQFLDTNVLSKKNILRIHGEKVCKKYVSFLDSVNYYKDVFKNKTNNQTKVNLEQVISLKDSIKKREDRHGKITKNDSIYIIDSIMPVIDQWLNKNFFPKIYEVGKDNFYQFCYLLVSLELISENTKYLSLIKNEFKNGWLTPDLYATFYDSYYYEKFSSFYYYQAVWLINDLTQYDEINDRRSEISLKPLEAYEFSFKKSGPVLKKLW